MSEMPIWMREWLLAFVLFTTVGGVGILISDWIAKGRRQVTVLRSESTKSRFKRFGMFSSHLSLTRPDGTKDVYMKRYIMKTPWFWIRLHNILRSDSDRHLHDHPFDFASLLLTGGYVEHTPQPRANSLKTVAKYWPRFSVVRKKAQDFHRLELTKPVWTLVITSRKYREWGFQTEDGWIHHSNYKG